MPILQVEGVSAGYSTRLVLQDISLAAGRGEFVSIIAPNGTGKSTLLRCISGVLPVKQGKVWLDGQPITAYSRRKAAQKIAVVGEDDSTFDFSVYQTVFMGRFPHLDRFQGETKEDHAIAEAALNDVGMIEKNNALMSQLSQGERQKVLIARALAQCPELLLLDEPTSHLDIRNQFVILQLIKDLTRKKNIAVIGVLHDINLALRFSDKLALLKDGKLLAYGPPEVLSEELLSRLYGMDFMLQRQGNHVFVHPSY